MPPLREKINNTFIEPLRVAPIKIETEVGDAKQADFYPQLKTKHWDNEANFSMRLKDELPHQGVVEERQGKIEWKRAGRTARFYEKDTGDQYGGYEFEVELESKPASNVIEYTLQTKGLKFYYQSALTPEKEGEVCDGLICTLNGEETRRRAENIVGSYAVYHESGINNKYLTGKAFHIYRPWAEDAVGERIWCDLHIDAEVGVASITIPQDFINKATYPILIDPTYGYTSIGASTVNGNADQDQFGNSFTQPTASGERVVGITAAISKAMSPPMDFQDYDLYDTIRSQSSRICGKAGDLAPTTTPTFLTHDIGKHLMTVGGTAYVTCNPGYGGGLGNNFLLSYDSGAGLPGGVFVLPTYVWAADSTKQYSVYCTTIDPTPNAPFGATNKKQYYFGSTIRPRIFKPGNSR